MKHLLLPTLLFSIIFNLNLIAQNEEDKGLWAVKKLIHYHNNAETSNHLGLRATLNEDLSNQVIITESGLLTIGTPDPCNDYELDLETLGSTLRLYVPNGGALKGDGPFWTMFSDQNLKTNIASFHKGLEELRQINFYEYEYNGLANTVKGKKQVGILAQEIQTVLPNTITTLEQKQKDGTSSQLYTFNPNELFYVSLNSIKELDQKNQELEQKTNQLLNMNEQIEELSVQLNDLKKLLGLDHTQSEERSLQKLGFLKQCVPNPTHGQVVIPYELSANAQNAQILIYDLQGQLIQSFDIPAMQNGQIEWNAPHLAKGVYTYVLKVNQQKTDAKKLIIN